MATVEGLFENETEFQLLSSYSDLRGNCDSSAGRTDFNQPWPATGQAYRLIIDKRGKGNARYGSLDEMGRVILRVELDLAGPDTVIASRWIGRVVDRYCLLKRLLDVAGISYKPDLDFDALFSNRAIGQTNSERPADPPQARTR